MVSLPLTPLHILVTLRLGRGDWLLLALYALFFALAHWLATFWGGRGFYSLWFPAAGLRLALLWRAGPRLTPWVALVELAVDAAMGIVWLGMPQLTSAIIAIVRPVLAYGLTIWLVRWLARRLAVPAQSPVPFGLAALFAPIIAALAALPQALYLPALTGVSGPGEIAASLLMFAVGDLLGVLSIAPPVLWLADSIANRRLAALRMPEPVAVAEGALAIGLALLGALMFRRLGIEVWTAPALLAVLWMGMRFGRGAAWITSAAAIAMTLAYSAGEPDATRRLELHLHLAILATVGYLAGSLAEAQAMARRELMRRDRMLFQAERLKTLRAMSVAVIHEISQPLTTIAIEARHLQAITQDVDPDIAASSGLIDRKATTLANLVRRLRRFGGRVVDEPSALPLATLIENVTTLAGPEAKAAGVRLSIGPVDRTVMVLAQEVELAQAVINLLRNAIAACDDGQVELDVRHDATNVTIEVRNRCAGAAKGGDGMGVGTIIARAIVEAHGGTLSRKRIGSQHMLAAITLPQLGGAG